MAKRKSKKLTIEELSREMIDEEISVEVPPTEEIPVPEEVEFEEEPLPQKKEEVAPPAAKKPEGMITLQEIGDRMRVIRAKKRSYDPEIQAEGTKELKDLNNELHAQEKKLKAFFGR